MGQQLRTPVRGHVDRPPRLWQAVRGRAHAAGGRLPGWARRWEFAAILLLGVLVRLLWLQDAMFLGDQAQLLSLARSALEHGAVPLTGIRSSMRVLNMPGSIYLLLPFALADPIWATLATALANVAAVVLLYRLADRYAGRNAAAFAGLLYATAPWAVYYSRFVWQQNLLAPVLLLFFVTLCAGAVGGWRGWLPWNVACWILSVQLHPTAAPLLGLTVMGMVFTRAALRRRDFVRSVLVLVVASLPTLLWEILSRGSDFAVLDHAGQVRVQRALGTLSRGAEVTSQAPQSVAQTVAVAQNPATHLFLHIVSPPAADAFGTASLYATLTQSIGWATPVVALLYVGSLLWLSASVVWQAVLVGMVADLRRSRAARRGVAIPRPAVSPMAQALHDPRWRFRALLTAWQAGGLLFLSFQTQTLFAHYLLFLLPGMFLLEGVFLARLLEAAQHVGGRVRGRDWPRARWAGYAVAVGTVALAGAQVVSTFAMLQTFHTGSFSGTPSALNFTYGLPLGTQRAVLQTALADARARHLPLSVASTSAFQESLGYLAQTGYGPASVYDGSECLLVPAPGARPLAVLALHPSAQYLAARRTGTTDLATLPLPGGAPPARVYQLDAAGRLPGEVAVPAAAAPGALPTTVSAVALDAAAPGGPQVVLRWTGTPSLARDPQASPSYWLGASPSASAPPVGYYRFAVRPYDANGQPLAADLTATCGNLMWGTGEDLYTALPLSDAVRQLMAAGRVASWHVVATRDVFLVTQPRLGPLRFETGDGHWRRDEAVTRETVLPAALMGR